jgi:hypothetical protein
MYIVLHIISDLERLPVHIWVNVRKLWANTMSFSTRDLAAMDFVINGAPGARPKDGCIQS